MVAAAAIGAVATIGSAAVSSSASSKASKAAKNAAKTNNALEQDIYNQNKAALSPYQQTGTKATTAIESLIGLGGDTGAANAAFDAYKGSTEYTSRLNQGANSVQAALGGKGLLDSGAAQKSLLKYGQTFASNEFGNYMGNLQGQQQTGLSAASALAGNGSNYANAVSNNNNNASTTVGNAAFSSANAINSALGSAVSAYGISQGLGSSYGNKPSALGNGTWI